MPFNVDQSLDDIIQYQRGRGGRGRGGTRGRGRARGAYQANTYSQPRGGFVPRNNRPFAIGGIGGPIRVNLANLYNVNVEDLEELFIDYPHDGITVHFDENGAPVGTADIHFKSKPSFAAKLVADCNGMRIDGRAIKFYLLGPRPNAHYVRPSFRQPFNRFGNSYNRFNGGYVHKRPTTTARVQTSTTANKKLSEAELDAQLDAYMAK